MAEDGIAEVVRRAQLGQKTKGVVRVSDHVTPEMLRQIIHALERRWAASPIALTPPERAQLGVWFSHLTAVELGDTEYGLPWTEPLLGRHWLISGETGSGKGSLIWNNDEDLDEEGGLITPAR